MSDDVLARAKAALEGVTEGPWIYIAGDDEEASVISEGEQLPDAITVGGITFNPGYSVAVDLRNGDAEFIAAAIGLVPELVAEVTRLRRVTDIIDPDSVYREQAEHWKSLWRQNTATAADAMRERDAAVAELEQARSDIADMQRLLRNPGTAAMLDAAERHINDALVLHIEDGEQ